MTCIDLPLATPCLSLCLSFTKVEAGDTVVAAAGGATDSVVALAGSATDAVVAAAGGATDEDKGGHKCTDNDNEYSNKILHTFLCKYFPSDVERSNRCFDNMWKQGKL